MISKGEKKIIQLLKEAHITFEKEKTFSDLQHNGVKYRFDFYLPYVHCGKCLIEFDGAQHYTAAWGGQTGLYHRQENDRKKNSYALRNGYKLYRIPYWEYDNINCYFDLLDDKFLVKDKWHNDKIKPPHSY